MATRKGRILLTRDDWAEAALAALAEGGVSAVTIEALARRLGATRGSFYWHFTDRAELVAAALARWEATGTTAIIAAIEAIADPREQLNFSFTAAFGNEIEGDVEAALAAHASDPLVAPVLERVAAARLAALERLFTRLGFAPAAATWRAQAVFAAYLGHFQVRRALASTGQAPSTAYIEQLLTLLAQPEAGATTSVLPPPRE